VKAGGKARTKAWIESWWLILFAAVLLLAIQSPKSIASQASTSVPHKKLPSRRDYVGDQTCRSCHQTEAKTYLETSHHLASSWPSPQTMKGGYAEGSNVLRTVNPYLHFEMTETKDGYFQSAVEEPGEGKRIVHTERIDIVGGEGRKGQSYIFWKGDQLFQLPVTYWTESNSWVNSPSYPDGSPHFDKAIIPRCLECHATYFDWLPPPVNRYNKSTLILGISCEKCHGPGREHVALHRANPKMPAGAAQAIVNPVKLARDRQIDVCGLCHSGAGAPIVNSLSFQPGGNLEDFIDLPYVSSENAVDVHGSQVQLLTRSRCYRSTTTMTCTTCHNVHEVQRDAAAFSSNCLGCHEAKQCGEFAKLGEKIAQNCIDCHMPLQESKVLFSVTNGKTIRPMVRNHQIGIYAKSGAP
jgi:Cytochrome c554 and c-prime